MNGSPRPLPSSRGTAPRTGGARAAWAPVAPGEWDAVATASPAATYFHTRPWSETIAAHDRRFEAQALAFVLPSGERALLPLVVRRGLLRRGLLRRAVSTQPGTYGGPLLPGRALAPEEWSAFVRGLRSAPFGRLDCFGNVLDPLPLAAAGGLQLAARETHRIDLAALPESPRSTYRKGCKHALTKAERAGVRCVRAELGPGGTGAVREAADGLLDAYVAAYHDSLRRWGRPLEKAYPPALLRELASRPGGELWCAVLPGGEVAAGGLFLFTTAACVWWHGAMRSDVGDVGASNALIHALVLEARARGCRWFDFNPSSGHSGVESFKSSFRAERTPLHAWTYRHPLAGGAGGARGARGPGGAGG